MKLTTRNTMPHVGIILAGFLVLAAPAAIVLASDATEFTQSITGSLDVAIVDSNGDAVASPSVAFSSIAFSVTAQTSTGTLGTSSQRMRVTNPTTTAPWSLVIAATSGNTTLWTSGGNNMDFNGSAANGRLTVDASGGTLAGVGGTSTANITKGSSTSFAQGTQDSVTLLTASGSAVAPGQWDFTGTSLTQDVPAAQTTGSYAIDMTITVS